MHAALDKKAEDVVVLDLRKAGGFTDFFVICTGGNTRQIVAIADGVRDTLKRDLDERPTLTEGIDRSEWILLDYFNFVVHVFSRDCRAFYGLERLWGNAVRHEVADGPRGQGSMRLRGRCEACTVRVRRCGRLGTGPAALTLSGRCPARRLPGAALRLLPPRWSHRWRARYARGAGKTRARLTAATTARCGRSFTR